MNKTELIKELFDLDQEIRDAVQLFQVELWPNISYCSITETIEIQIFSTAKGIIYRQEFALDRPSTFVGELTRLQHEISKLIMGDVA